jgi:hypothetical protein
MANIVPYAFPVELLKASHNFATNNFKLALYTAIGNYTANSTVYDTNSEVSSAGSTRYITGGNALAGQAVSNTTNIATVDFTDVVWGDTVAGTSTFSSSHAALYNTSSGNKLVVILDFNGTKSCSNGTFTVTFPSPTSNGGADALLSITS